MIETQRRVRLQASLLGDISLPCHVEALPLSNLIGIAIENGGELLMLSVLFPIVTRSQQPEEPAAEVV